MTQAAEVRGTLMVREGLLLPPEVDIATEKYTPAWRAVSGCGGFDLDQRLRKAGWACFFLADELKSMSFGAGSLERAVRKLLAKVKMQEFNCAELTSVTRSTLLGIPYCRVRGHSRHIQRGFEVDALDTRIRLQEQTDWAQK